MTDASNLRIGKKIRSTMKAYGISVKELSNKTGIELQTIYSILNGHHKPSVEKLQAISKVLQLSIDALLDIEVNTFPIFAEEHEATFSYARFEEIWFGPTGGDRISVSRNFSVMNQSEELRREYLKNIYEFTDEQVEKAIEAFRKRKKVIQDKEKNRIEFVVQSEIIDYIQGREPFNKLSRDLVFESVEGIIKRLADEPLRFEVIIIPRQHFLVNYEIINREVILFDLGTVFFRQTHPKILQHFLKEVEALKFRKAKIADREKVIEFLREQLNNAK
jgi:transcriptional regulator with XRE-family HTH domain